MKRNYKIVFLSAGQKQICPFWGPKINITVKKLNFEFSFWRLFFEVKGR